MYKEIRIDRNDRKAKQRRKLANRPIGNKRSITKRKGKTERERRKKNHTHVHLGLHLMTRFLT